MPQAVVGYLLLYADDTCTIFQYKNVTEIEKQLLRDFFQVCVAGSLIISWVYVLTKTKKVNFIRY